MSARISTLRRERGWSQTELAERAGVTRQLVGAVESGRHAPNVVAALGLAKALDVTVEDLFAEQPQHDQPSVLDAMGMPLVRGDAVATARVGDQIVAVSLPHGGADANEWGVADAVMSDDGPAWLPGASTDGVVIAGCDPLLGLASGLLERTSHHRVLVVHASTGAALDALAAGRLHGAVVHGPVGKLPKPPSGIRRFHIARWQVGLASRQRGGPPSIAQLAERSSKVVQREPGAGTQDALERALRAVGADRLPGPVAKGHLDVARRIVHGGVGTGVTMEAAAIAYDLGFAPLEEHAIELWSDQRWVDLPAMQALLGLLGSAALTERAKALAGYELDGCGDELRAS